MKKLIVANWKCNPATLRQAQELFRATIKAVPKSKNVKVVVCPPSVYLSGFRFSAKGGSAFGGQVSGLKLGAQDVFWEDTGAYTGAVGPRMLKSVGVTYVVMGHSERREQFGDTNESVRKKVAAALKGGLCVIVCVGEKTREADASEYALYVKKEVEEALRGISKAALKNVVVAYEPLWAIGSDEADTPESTLEMALYIRKIIAGMFGNVVAQSFPVLYGGSVNIGNARAFLRDGGVDGLLVGRASLDSKAFGKIVEEANGL
ncbi:MAG: triosephosphate isomerase (TIM) [Parcubacteria group bacterium Gr01-1014_29]|nr:MAG: triosephosphate isomerase (TIM) [Parcubacteria group bacterium Gr01-1014_29]